MVRVVPTRLGAGTRPLRHPSPLPLRCSPARHSRAVLSVASPPRNRFAVLKAGHASPYIEGTHGGYGRMLARLLRDDGEHWDIFHVVDGDFSFLNDAHAYDGFVITGSAADAHDSETAWIVRLADELGQLHAQGQKLLGICFGHQILARALGGKTGRAAVGWELGVKRLDVDSEGISRMYGLELPASLNAIESHRDQVSSVPHSAVVLASSEETEIEMFAIGDHVLGIQCHPEFNKDVTLDIIQGRLSSKVISDEVASEAITSFEKRKPDQEPLKALCKTFLKGHREVRSNI